VSDQPRIDVDCDLQLSQPAQQTLRTALKLLLSTTILSLVPKLTCFPSSLSAHFSLQSFCTHDTVSAEAPKLLTRQIKSSTYYLQKRLLCELFSHFHNASKLVAEVRLAVALIVAFVLELVRNAGRTFARYASKIDERLVINQLQVTEYERAMERQVFERVRASVDGVGRLKGLGERLRSSG